MSWKLEVNKKYILHIVCCKVQMCKAITKVWENYVTEKGQQNEGTVQTHQFVILGLPATCRSPAQSIHKLTLFVRSSLSYQSVTVFTTLLPCTDILDRVIMYYLQNCKVFIIAMLTAKLKKNSHMLTRF